MFVLGIDPGVSRCGYGLATQTGGRSVAKAIGVIETPPDQALATRLATLQVELGRLFDEFHPDVLAIERVLFSVNVQTAMSVGQASGLAMAEAGQRGIPVVEYSPNQIKLAVAGHGNAAKDEVQRMVQITFRLTSVPQPADAADAAAVALCHLAQAGHADAVAAAGARR